jgi:hypothetical protein
MVQTPAVVVACLYLLQRCHSSSGSSSGSGIGCWLASIVSAAAVAWCSVCCLQQQRQCVLYCMEGSFLSCAHVQLLCRCADSYLLVHSVFCCLLCINDSLALIPTHVCHTWHSVLALLTLFPFVPFGTSSLVGNSHQVAWLARCCLSCCLRPSVLGPCQSAGVAYQRDVTLVLLNTFQTQCAVYFELSYVCCSLAAAGLECSGCACYFWLLHCHCVTFSCYFHTAACGLCWFWQDVHVPLFTVTLLSEGITRAAT